MGIFDRIRSGLTSPLGSSNGGGGSGAISPLTTKGDIWGYSTLDARVPVGTNGQVLFADSTQALGVKWATVSGSGTVTSVALTTPAFLSVAGSPVTTSGTLAVTLATQLANLVFAGPTSGGALAPMFRSLVAADIPSLNYISSLTSDVTTSGFGAATATIAPNAVTNAKLNQMPAHTFKGNNTGSTANALDLTQVQLTAELNQFTTSLQGVVPSSGGGTVNFLRADGTWATPPNSGGTVTSVALTVPSILSVSGSPITTSGTLAVTLATQSANLVFSGPITGGAVTPTFRLLDPTDIPTITSAKISDFQTAVSANVDVAADTAARHNAVTIGTGNGLSLSTQILSLQLATSSQNGALSSTDWTTFNSKISSTEKGQPNGVATLDAGGKLPVTQLPHSVMEFQGQWDASTNTPTLADGTGDAGDIYRVNVAGTQNLGSGSQTFSVGDWVMYSGTIWQIASNSNAVVSVNGLAGVVVLTTTNIAEGTNLYYTDERAQDGVGNILSNTATINFTYNDAGNLITADVNSASISNAKLSTMAAHTFKGNNTGSTGAPLDLTATQLTAELNQFTSSLQGVVPSSGGGTTNFLRADGTWTTPAGAGNVVGPASATDNAIVRFDTTTGKLIQDSLATIDDSGNLTANNFSGTSSGTNTGNQTITLTGDVTGSGTGSFAATIASNVVMNAKLAQMAAHTFKGNNTGGTANAQDLTATQLTAELNQFTTSLQGLVPGSGGGTTNFLRADGTWTTPGGGGTVISVALTVPSFLSVSGSPVTSSGTLAVTLATQNANLVFAGPSSGGAATPTFRSLVVADLPTIDIAHGGTGQTTANAAFNALAPSQTSNSGKFLTTDGTNTSWATVTAVQYVVSTISTTTTLVSGNTYFLSAGSFTITLPAPTANSFVRVKDITGTISANNVTVARNAGGNTIENLAANYILQNNFGSWTFVADGSGWWLLP